MKSSRNFKENLRKQTKFNSDELEKFDQVEQEAIARYAGDLRELESALGMAILGRQYGWKVIHLLHSKATVKKYEEILRIKVREEFPEKTATSIRNNGFKLVQKVSNFWKAASGELVKLPDKHLAK